MGPGAALAQNRRFTQQPFQQDTCPMQYFGNLRRNPDDAPDLTSATNLLAHEAQSVQRDFVDAEMVKAFVTSGENSALGP